MSPADYAQRSILVALSTVGTPYEWGKDGPLYDCSGACRHWLEAATDTQWRDRTANDWFKECEASIEPGAGLWAFYGNGRATHMVLLLTNDGMAVVGANGGGRFKLGESVLEYRIRMAAKNAGIRVEGYRRVAGVNRSGYLYRGQFLGFRIPPYPED